MFYYRSDDNLQEKIECVLDLIRFENSSPTYLLKYLEGTDQPYEIRIKAGFEKLEKKPTLLKNR
ncbi:MAG: hypothetical protein AAF693_19870 [Bacteroidota bacterium]